MKKGVLFLVSIAAALTISLSARTASALICCSACDANPELRACAHGCSPSCVIDDGPIDDEPIVQDRVVYDEVAKVCYAVADQ